MSQGSDVDSVDAAGEWDLDDDEDDSDDRPSTIVADRIRSAGSSAGRTSSKLSEDEYLGYISEALASKAVGEAFLLPGIGPLDSVDEQDRRLSDDACDVEPDDPLADVLVQIERELSDCSEALLQAGVFAEPESPAMTLLTVSSDFRLLPASSWAALHAPFRPPGAAEAQQQAVAPQVRFSPETTSPRNDTQPSPEVRLRLAPSDALQYTMSGPLGFTETMLDEIMEEEKEMSKARGLMLSSTEDGEEAIALTGVPGGDFRQSPTSSWSALHAPFRPAGVTEAIVESPKERTLETKIDAEAEAPVDTSAKSIKLLIEAQSETTSDAHHEDLVKAVKVSTVSPGLERKVANLEEKVDHLESNVLATGDSKVVDLENQVGDLQSKVAALESKVAALETPAAPVALDDSDRVLAGAESLAQARTSALEAPGESFTKPSEGACLDEDFAATASTEAPADVHAHEQDISRSSPEVSLSIEATGGGASESHVVETPANFVEVSREVIAPGDTTMETMSEAEMDAAVLADVSPESGEPGPEVAPKEAAVESLPEAGAEAADTIQVAAALSASPEAAVEPNVEAEVNEQQPEAEAMEHNVEAEVNEQQPEAEAMEPNVEAEVNEQQPEAEAMEHKTDTEVKEQHTDAEVNEPKSDAEVNEPKVGVQLDEPKLESQVERDAVDMPSLSLAEASVEVKVEEGLAGEIVEIEPQKLRTEQDAAEMSTAVLEEALADVSAIASADAFAYASAEASVDASVEASENSAAKDDVEGAGAVQVPLDKLEQIEPSPAEIGTDAPPADISASQEIPDEDLPSRVQPAESLGSTYGAPFGKTAQVLDSVMLKSGVDLVEESGIDATMKFASSMELTAAPGQTDVEASATSKPDPVVKRKTQAGLEHEAWVASVFGGLAAETPLDRRPLRKPGMKRLSTLSIARALGCLPAGQQDLASPSLAGGSHMAHAPSSIRSPLSSVPMSSQPRSLWTPPSPPAPSSIRSQGSSEVQKASALASIPATGFRLSPSTSANSEVVSAALICRSAVPGLDMTKVRMGYDDDDDTDDGASSLMKTKGLSTMEAEGIPTSGAKAEVPQLNMSALQQDTQFLSKTNAGSGSQHGLTSPPAPRGVLGGSGGTDAREEHSEQPPRPHAPTPGASQPGEAREIIRPPSRGDNMVVGCKLDYWRGGKPARRATMDADYFAAIPQRHNVSSAGGVGLSTGGLGFDVMQGIERRAVSASELRRPMPQYNLKAHSSNADLPFAPAAAQPIASPSAFPASKSAPSLPSAVRDSGGAPDLGMQAGMWGQESFTLDPIGYVVADKKMPFNVPAVVRLPPVQKKQALKWQVGDGQIGISVQKRGKATIVSHTHVHHHHHYHVRRPGGAADTGPGVPGASAVST